MKPSQLAVIASAAAAAVLLAACAGGSIAKYDPKLPADQQAKTYLAAERTGNMKTVKKVFISSFDVLFVTKSAASAQAGGGVGQGTTNVHAYYHLKNVDDARMQAITEKLFADAKAKLAAAGYELVDLSADPLFAKLTESAEASPYDQHGTRIFAPKGMGVWAGPGSVVQTSGRRNRIAQGAGDSPAQFEAQLMAEKGVDAVHFTCQIDYANLETHGGYGAGEARVQGTVVVNVNRGSMQFLAHERVTKQNKPFHRGEFMYITDPKFVNIYLKQPIVAEGAFATVKDTTNGGVAALQLLMGGRKDKTFDVEADPAAYESLAVTHGEALMDMVLATAKL